MPQIQVQPPVQPDIYSFGFDKNMNRTIPGIDSGVGRIFGEDRYNESDVIFDSVKGHNHDGTFSAPVSAWQFLPKLTYISADSVKISGDLTSTLDVGDKLKLTQGLTTKYFYISGISYSSPFTTMTATGGTTYQLANSEIANAFYSKFNTPQGFPHWFAWTPTLTIGGSSTYTSQTVRVARFCIIGRNLFFQCSFTGTVGGGADAPDVRFTLPMNSSQGGTADFVGGGAFASVTGVEIGAEWTVDTTNTAKVYAYDNRNWSAGATSFAIQGYYEIV